MVAADFDSDKSRRLASIGLLTAEVAHEINNPLAVISGYAELCARQLRGSAEDERWGDLVEALQVIREEAFRCKQIAGRLLSLARGSSARREPTSLGEVARQVVAMTRALEKFRDRRLALRLNESRPLDVLANPDEMKQVLLNLITNALDATPPGGEVRIEARRHGSRIELAVSDDGQGISPDAIDRLFDRFHSGKSASADSGTGLGLSITKAIVDSHGGDIRATSDGPGRGARFIVTLPAHEPASVN